MRKMKTAVFLLALLLLLTGCAERRENSIDFFAMDTSMTVRAYGADDALLEQTKTIARSLEEKLSVTKPDSEIARLNQCGEAALSDESAELLQAALALCARTDGKLDVTVYPVVRAWGFTTGNYRVPTDAELAEFLKTVDYRTVTVQDGKAFVPAGTMVDLGSVAKGYAADCMCALLRENGVRSAVLDLGGNVQVLGKKPNGTPWQIGIRAPEGETYLGVLAAEDEAIVTSGGYERCFTDENGIKRCHIMNPETAYPADSGLVSVTVVGKSGLTCDGLSTALFVMGKESAEAFWRETGGFEMILLTEEGQLFVTPELFKRFTPGDFPVEVMEQ